MYTGMVVDSAMQRKRISVEANRDSDGRERTAGISFDAREGGRSCSDGDTDGIGRGSADGGGGQRRSWWWSSGRRWWRWSNTCSPRRRDLPPPAAGGATRGDPFLFSPLGHSREARASTRCRTIGPRRPSTNTRAPTCLGPAFPRRLFRNRLGTPCPLPLSPIVDLALTFHLEHPRDTATT